MSKAVYYYWWTRMIDCRWFFKLIFFPRGFFHSIYRSSPLAVVSLLLLNVPLSVVAWPTPVHPLRAQSSSHTLCIYPVFSKATSFIPHVSSSMCRWTGGWYHSAILYWICSWFVLWICPPLYRCTFKDSDLYNCVCVFCSHVIELLFLQIEHLIVFTTDVATRTFFRSLSSRIVAKGSLPRCLGVNKLNDP